MTGAVLVAVLTTGCAEERHRETGAPPAPAAGQRGPTTDGEIGAGSSAAVPPRITAVLQAIRANDGQQLAVSEEDGRFLRVLVASAGVQRALEIGGASGYSAIWIGLGLRETGGRLVTIEYDPGRARELEENIRRAGLEDVVTVLAGDAFERVPALEGTFDFVFLDAWKRDYQRFFDLIYPRLDGGGLFVGHNVVNKRDELGDFLTTVTAHPALLTTIVSPSSEGMSVSFKKRS
jgi:predicted O-methyltransferase YrrM